MTVTDLQEKCGYWLSLNRLENEVLPSSVDDGEDALKSCIEQVKTACLPLYEMDKIPDYVLYDAEWLLERAGDIIGKLSHKYPWIFEDIDGEALTTSIVERLFMHVTPNGTDWYFVAYDVNAVGIDNLLIYGIR